MGNPEEGGRRGRWRRKKEEEKKKKKKRRIWVTQKNEEEEEEEKKKGDEVLGMHYRRSYADDIWQRPLKINKSHCPSSIFIFYLLSPPLSPRLPPSQFHTFPHHEFIYYSTLVLIQNPKFKIPTKFKSLWKFLKFAVKLQLWEWFLSKIPIPAPATTSRLTPTTSTLPPSPKSTVKPAATYSLSVPTSIKTTIPAPPSPPKDNLLCPRTWPIRSSICARRARPPHPQLRQQVWVFRRGVPPALPSLQWFLRLQQRHIGRIAMAGKLAATEKRPDLRIISGCAGTGAMPGVFAEGELLDRDHQEHFAGWSSADNQDLSRWPPIDVACREAICRGQAHAFSEEEEK